MKTTLNISGLLRIAVVILVSLWVGYAAGYHRGVRDDTAWVDSRGNRLFVGPQPEAIFDTLFVRQNPIPVKIRQ
jgi:hypothetical protein